MEHWVSDAGALEKDVRCVQGDIKKATKIYILLMLDFKIFWLIENCNPEP